MNENTKSTESKTDSSQTTNSGYGEETTSDTPPDTTTEEITTDEFGYSVEKDTEEKPVDTPKVEEGESTEEKPTDDVEVEKKATGYGESEDSEDDSEADKKDDAPEEEKKVNEEDVKKELSETIKNLPEGYSQEKVLDFALKNGLNNDQVKAYVDMELEAQKQVKQMREQNEKAQRKSWVEELRNDNDFGGENFDSSVSKAEKVLEKHFPNVKKTLTERGGMLPPYIMKDFLKLYKTLNPTAPLVSGEPIPTKPKDDGNFLDDLYQ